MEMNDKHLEMLGSNVRRMMQSPRLAELNDNLIGLMVVQYVNILEQEAERDARDRANGKGE